MAEPPVESIATGFTLDSFGDICYPLDAGDATTISPDHNELRAEMTTLTIMGAGGKMGTRITEQVMDDPDYEVRYVEPAEAGQKRLAERGVSTTPASEALADSDAVIMAVPDDKIGQICEDVVPSLDEGALVVLLDPAAAYAGVLPDRSDISYFITHPCHPPVFDEERDPAHVADWFGGQGMARQDIVCALHQGAEEDFELGERIAIDIYRPVRRSHRLSTEEMALLEPALAESLAATLIDVIHEGMETVVDEMGVPEQAAYDFLMGHLRIELAIIFGMTDFPFSDAAKKKMEEAREELLVEDWQQILTVERTKESACDIAGYQ